MSQSIDEALATTPEPLLSFIKGLYTASGAPDPGTGKLEDYLGQLVQYHNGIRGEAQHWKTQFFNAQTEANGKRYNYPIIDAEVISKG